MPRAKAKRRKPGRVMMGVALAIGVGWFAVEGGEYGTSDLLRLRARRAMLARELDSLRWHVDSLDRVKAALTGDPTVQERIAREEFGMVKGDKELLYRLVDK